MFDHCGPSCSVNLSFQSESVESFEDRIVSIIRYDLSEIVDLACTAFSRERRSIPRTQQQMLCTIQEIPYEARM
jgi:hypothetical protein